MMTKIIVFPSARKVEHTEKQLHNILKTMSLNSCKISKIMNAVDAHVNATLIHHKEVFVKPLILERFKNMIEDV
jgi:hypothetical protein